MYICIFYSGSWENVDILNLMEPLIIQTIIMRTFLQYLFMYCVSVSMRQCSKCNVCNECRWSPRCLHSEHNIISLYSVTIHLAGMPALLWMGKWCCITQITLFPVLLILIQASTLLLRYLSCFWCFYSNDCANQYFYLVNSFWKRWVIMTPIIYEFNLSVSQWAESVCSQGVAGCRW